MHQPFDHKRANVLDFEFPFIDCDGDVTMWRCGIDHFYSSNDLCRWVRINRGHSRSIDWFDFQLPITALCTCVHCNTAKGHLIEAIFICARCWLWYSSPEDVSLNVIAQQNKCNLCVRLHYSGWRWQWLVGRCEPRTTSNKYVIYLLQNIYGFHTIYNHFYIRCCWSAAAAWKCVYYKWSGLVPNAR